MLRIGSAVISVALVVGLFGGLSVASAQEELQKRENVEYYRVVNLNFKQGHNQDAWAILYGKIAPAVRAAGRDFIAIDWETGPWDTTIYINMKDGYGSMEYATSPQRAAFRAALNEQEGGEEAAAAVLAEWGSHIESSDNDIGHLHLPPPEEDTEEE